MAGILEDNAGLLGAVIIVPERLGQAGPPYNVTMKFNGEISVTYTGGVLRPDQSLDLPEGTRLRAAIRPESPDPVAAAKAMDTIRRISESGVFRSGGRKLTRDQMHERR